jgi:hypothetical protein
MRVYIYTQFSTNIFFQKPKPKFISENEYKFILKFLVLFQLLKLDKDRY